MPVFHRHRLPWAWSPRDVPIGPVEVDWSHPLSIGLICIYIPGSFSGLADIAGNGPKLVPATAGRIVATPFGSGLNGTVASSGAGATVTPAITSRLLTAGSAYWRGTVGGASLGGSASYLFGLSASNNDTAPYDRFGVNDYFGGYCAIQGIPANTTGTIQTPTVNEYASPAIASMVATFRSGGNLLHYINGVLAGSTTAYVGSMVYGTTAQVEMTHYTGQPSRSPNATTEVGMLYSRDLSPAEIMILDVNPYVMLRPAKLQPRRFAVSVPTPFRRPTMFISS